MLGKLLIIFAGVTLSACSVMKEPATRTVIQRVEVPVYMPCAAEIPVKPAFNFDNLRVEDDIFEKIKAMLSDRHLHIGYQDELLAALKSCK